ncbi:MAG TPA: 2-oxoglutarate dehydrogenase complex dihydrolipoyllysine-residue succinyltransferase, partial [Allosphingosinicella sp.]|nr:2-oxoglutarate dehydrogenase complex dihydrolipoyllysine-residue succinyltransferase [Allosphingosinicella sp.]
PNGPGENVEVRDDEDGEGNGLTLSPSVRRLVLELGVDPSKIRGTGKDGRLTKDDVLAAARDQKAAASAPAPTPSPPPPPPPAPPSAPVAPRATGERREERVRMTRLRQTVARRLKEAQNTAAMLTTFNDVDMTAVMEARNRYKDLFEKKHQIRLGFMSFFVKAAVLAAKDVPSVNAYIEGDEIVYHDYVDVSVAVSAPNGLVVPVIRDADKLSFAEIEQTIGDFGKRAKAGTLTTADMAGGTFTISNGGVFGSLISTPIINPPQSAVLGMHRIEERPVVLNGQIVARPMMYLALSYDHRLVDGREAVTFLVRMKEAIEDPTRLLIDL